jgi:chromosome partitioning protein
MGYEPDLTIEEAADFDVTEEAIIVNTLASVMTPFLDRARGGHARHAEGQIIKMPFGSNGPHLLPADTFLSDIEQTLAGAKVSRELSLRKLLAAGCQGAIPGFDLSGYDVIMFDCPPNVSHVSTIALAAADIVIAPIRLDAFSMKGLTKLMRELEGLREAFRVQPELIILPTHYAPQLSRVYRMQTRLGQYRDMMAPGVISASEEFPKSLDAYLPLTVQRPTCASVKEYKDFAEFLHGRILATATELARATT